MLAATAAILPSLMATSRIALSLFFPSITWPPFSSRSYSGWAIAHTAAANRINAFIGVDLFTITRFDGGGVGSVQSSLLHHDPGPAGRLATMVQTAIARTSGAEVRRPCGVGGTGSQERRSLNGNCAS